jgi:hypothetical protein
MNVFGQAYENIPLVIAQLDSLVFAVGQMRVEWTTHRRCKYCNAGAMVHVCVCGCCIFLALTYVRRAIDVLQDMSKRPKRYVA